MALKNLKYTEQHEWAKLDGDIAVVGITDHAQEELGDITYVELPEVGKEVKKSEAVSVVESVKAASDVYAPVSGIIKEVNNDLEENPGKINRDAYGQGWICKIEILESSEAEELMTSDEYEKFLEEETQ